MKNACADNSRTSVLPTLEPMYTKMQLFLTNASMLILILETLWTLHVLTVQVRNEECELAATLGFDQHANSHNHMEVKIAVVQLEY